MGGEAGRKTVRKWGKKNEIKGKEKKGKTRCSGSQQRVVTGESVWGTAK